MRSLTIHELAASMILAMGLTLLDPTVALAQLFGGHHQSHRNACNCRQWTCQICQQQMLCPPQLPTVPDTLEMSPEAGVATPEPPITDALADAFESGQAPTSPSPNAADLFGQNLSAGAAGAFGSSLLAATTPEMMGDFFGPGSLPSIVAESFPIDTSNVIGVGGGILALELDGDYPPNDFFSLAPPALNTDGSSTIQLGPPTDPGDVPQPAGTGFSYLSGDATQQSGRNNWVGSYSYGKPILVPGGAYVLGRMKIAENFSPIPRDRFFFNYSLFNNVPLTANGVTVNRFTPGFEKTFLDGMASFELRTPFASTLNTDIVIDGSPEVGHTEFGNLFFALKAKLIERRNHLLTGGLSISAPTADDTRVLTGSGTELLRISNDSVHVMPFLGGAYVPNRNLFAIGSLQIDVDANGNRVLSNDGSGLQRIGRLQDMTLLYLDASIGYWVHRTASGRGISGIAPIAELHFNRSLNAADQVGDGITLVRNPIQEFDNLNTLFGVIVGIGQQSRFALGYAVPMGNGSDRVFDSELRVTFNRFF